MARPRLSTGSLALDSLVATDAWADRRAMGPDLLRCGEIDEPPIVFAELISVGPQVEVGPTNFCVE